MRLEYYPLTRLRREIVTVVGRYLDLSQYHLFFFGSRVAGKGTDRSDIDVGIDGEVPVPLTTLAAIEDDIEEIPTLYKIDVVDFARVTEKFKQVALEHSEPIVA